MVRLLAVVAALALIGIPAAGAEELFNPNARCADELEKSHEDFLLIRTGWAVGYLAAKTGDINGFGEGPFEELIEKIEAACEAAPDTTFVDLVDSLQ